MPHFETEVGILVRILEVWFLKHCHIPCHYHLFPLRDYPVRDNPVRPPSVPPSNPNTTIALSFQFRLYGNGCNSRTAIRWGVRAGMEWPRASLPSLGHPLPALKCGCQPRISSNPLPEVWNGLQPFTLPGDQRLGWKVPLCTSVLSGEPYPDVKLQRELEPDFFPP